MLLQGLSITPSSILERPWLLDRSSLILAPNFANLLILEQSRNNCLLAHTHTRVRKQERCKDMLGAIEIGDFSNVNHIQMSSKYSSFEQ